MRCSQGVFVLKTETPQVADLRCHVELEGIEPSTSSMPSMVRIDQQSSRKGPVLGDHSGGYRIEPLWPVGPQMARAIYRANHQPCQNGLVEDHSGGFRVDG